MLRAILYVGMAICIYAIYLQSGFILGFITEPENPHRYEYLGGLLLTGLIFSIAWLLTPVLATVKKNRFNKVERVLSYILSFIALMGFISTFLLDFIF